MEKSIVVKLTIPGVHSWPKAFFAVRYLAHEHRHVFHIRIEKRVSHNDRDIEIITFKNAVTEWLMATFWDDDMGVCDFENRSCEDIAQHIMEEYDCSLVEVLEDNENGAICRSAS